MHNWKQEHDQSHAHLVYALYFANDAWWLNSGGEALGSAPGWCGSG